MIYLKEKIVLLSAIIIVVFILFLFICRYIIKEWIGENEDVQ